MQCNYKPKNKTMEKVKIIQDQRPESPREWDNLGTIAYKHSRYTLGEVEINDPIDWLEDMLGITNKWEYTNDRLNELEERFYKEYIALPLYLYDHSGITISTGAFSCPWDSGKVGYIYMSKDKAYQEFGYKAITQKRREKLLQYLEGEVKTFDDYITGNVYGFVIEKDGEVVDSCSGFYGTDWHTNGITDHIPKHLHDQLNNIEIEY